MNRRMGVLISGRGSNLQALIDAIIERRLDATIALVISNRADAAGLARARETSGWSAWPASCACSGRSSWRRIRMRSSTSIPRCRRRFPASMRSARPWEHGVKISGATVHFATTDLDGGPVILQAAVPVRDDDTPETLAARILAEEHRIYPEAIKIVLDRKYRIEGRRVIRLE